MSNVNNLLTLLEGNLEQDLLPVAIGALQILQKNPSILGVEAAKDYVLGNAPAALLAGEAQLMQQEILILSVKLAAFRNPPVVTATPLQPIK
jgi:hypothetical protein